MSQSRQVVVSVGIVVVPATVLVGSVCNVVTVVVVITSTSNRATYKIILFKDYLKSLKGNKLLL